MYFIAYEFHHYKPLHGAGLAPITFRRPNIERNTKLSILIIAIADG